MDLILPSLLVKWAKFLYFQLLLRPAAGRGLSRALRQGHLKAFTEVLVAAMDGEVRVQPGYLIQGEQVILLQFRRHKVTMAAEEETLLLMVQVAVAVELAE
jgi:hypothetical protein